MSMRECCITFLILLAVTDGGAQDSKGKYLSPEEAAKKVDEHCNVQMEVKSIGKGKGVIYLNSKANYKDTDNFTVFINKAGVDQFKEAKIDDPGAHFKSKWILVTGTVKLYRDKPEIIVENTDQIQVLDK